MKQSNSLFLSQSYRDTWDDYNRALSNPSFTCWDHVILTASNEQQAEGFRQQIAIRKADGFLPSKTNFAVLPDPFGKRVGSGGATLEAIRYIVDQNGSSDLSKLRILVIHSGGDSKRVPQYSAIGKLFSPVPHELPNGRASTLFDEFMISLSSIPSRIREGMLLLSGDVLLLFNPLQIDFSGNGAAAISFKEDVQTGKDHGVFLRGEDGSVAKFLHKQSIDTLRSCGAVNERGCVDIDTGAVIFSSEILSALYSLISTDDKFDQQKYDALVNDRVRLSLYGDFLYPLASDSTLSDFLLEKPEGEFCDELTAARQALWNTLRSYRMKLLRLAPAKFIHFGTTREILKLMEHDIDSYSSLGWSGKVCSSISSNTAGYRSVLSPEVSVGEGCYLEMSYVHGKAEIGDHVLLSQIEIQNEKIPSNVVLHAIKQRDGKYIVRIYGTNDNPKEKLEKGASFLNSTLEAFIEKHSLSVDDLFDTDDHSLWKAKLYKVCDSMSEAVAAALELYDLVNGNRDISNWKNSDRISLCDGFYDADELAVFEWEKRMSELVSMNQIEECIYAKQSADNTNALPTLSALTKVQSEWLAERSANADHYKRMRLYYYVGKALGSEGDVYLTECFKTVSDTILQDKLRSIRYNDKCRIAKDRHTTSLALRVNFGGGWSDTPPYCIENGGTVLNAAILLNGRKPVEVTIEHIRETKIIFDSRDMDVHGEFDRIEDLQNTGDPYDPFALQKACLIACGILPQKGGELSNILDRIGGGFIIHSEVIGVPKGSGLGTSSILSAACVRSVFEFMDIKYTENDIYANVLRMEQIMSTGGGWQDQVGGLTDGIKYIRSAPGIPQKLSVDRVNLPQKALIELNERFALIYTGQRRLARNLLRDVVGRYVGNEADTVYALNEIQRLAALMRFELERGHIDDFASLLDRHWELSKMIDYGSTNTLIDQIFGSIDDLICGRMVCGAGGGGFLQVILKKGISRAYVQKRLREIFQDSDVGIWESTFI